MNAADARRIVCSNTRKIAGSVNVDRCLVRLIPDEPRWDYAIGQSASAADIVHWVEVHPCNASEVEQVIRKLAWLKTWVGVHARTEMSQRYIWIPSGKAALPPTAPQYKRAAAHGIKISPRQCYLF